MTVIPISSEGSRADALLMALWKAKQELEEVRRDRDAWRTLAKDLAADVRAGVDQIEASGA